MDSVNSMKRRPAKEDDLAKGVKRIRIDGTADFEKRLRNTHSYIDVYACTYGIDSVARPHHACVIAKSFAHTDFDMCLALGLAATYIQRLAATRNPRVAVPARELLATAPGYVVATLHTTSSAIIVYCACIVLAHKVVGLQKNTFSIRHALAHLGINLGSNMDCVALECSIAGGLGWRLGALVR